MRTNTKRKSTLVTHEGASAKRINAEQQLRRTVMACMLWEGSFYEDGETVASRIADCVKAVDPFICASIATEARTQMNLRHVPLLIAREMAKLPTHRLLVGGLLPEIIKRPDEIAEFLSIYWKDGKTPISAQVKKGLADSFQNFNEYQLAKYNSGKRAIKLRDVLFLTHAKPQSVFQAELWKKLVDGTLAIPDTWETNLSAGMDKKDTWERLMREDKLGALALLRNIRNMLSVSVDERLLADKLRTMNTSRVLPFRFIAAAKYGPQFESELEDALFRNVKEMPRFDGKTVILVDNSGSMYCNLSMKSDMYRTDAACGLAMIMRELCGNVRIHAFSDEATPIPNRRGFALRDAIQKTYSGGTYLGDAISKVNTQGYDRIIVITDEQSHDNIPNPIKGTKAYMINVGAYQNGVGYGNWHHIDGFSEAIVKYITEIENSY